MKNLNIPSVKWNKYNKNVIFDEDRLWTVRVATLKGDDLNLPRAVGVKSDEAKKFAEKLLRKYNDEALIVYYPYFIADKSGILEIKPDGYVIEAVKDDLWNLVTDGKRDITIKMSDNKTEIHGDDKFLTEKETDELLQQERKIRGKLRQYLLDGKSILLEWSFAVDTDITGERIGEPYLLFYECRTI